MNNLDIDKIEIIRRKNVERVLAAFKRQGVSSSHFSGTDGYGYDDSGRDIADRLFADVFGKEKAIVRHNFASGTHTLWTALKGILRPNDEIVFACGEPYDTLLNSIKDEHSGFESHKINYKFIPLLSDDGDIDFDAIGGNIKTAKVIYIQRSRGYSLRRSYSVDEVNKIITFAKSINPKIISIVDNCYGEFCEEKEPNGDIIVGSLIKNAGAGIARTGGYIAGKSELVELCADALFIPGAGFEIGASLGHTREILMGLFRASDVVADARLISVYAVQLAKKYGYEAETSHDITTMIKLLSPEKVIQFCETIQANSPIDSNAKPIPAPMPGYICDIIMASGSFTLGSSIELSADAPIKEPYSVYLQGGAMGLTAAKIAVELAFERIGFIN